MNHYALHLKHYKSTTFEIYGEKKKYHDKILQKFPINFFFKLNNKKENWAEAHTEKPKRKQMAKTLRQYVLLNL